MRSGKKVTEGAINFSSPLGLERVNLRFGCEGWMILFYLFILFFGKRLNKKKSL